MVAKIKARIPGPEPLMPHPWRRYLRHLARWMLVCALTMLAAATVLPLVGCAAPTTEVCGTLLDGSEFCTILKGTR